MTVQNLQDASAHDDSNVRRFRAKPDASVGPAAEAGWYLERERVRLGDSIGTVARATGLIATRIRAIEIGELTVFEVAGDALETLSIYADYLGYEPQPLIDHYRGFVDEYLRAVRPSGDQLILDSMIPHQSVRSDRRPVTPRAPSRARQILQKGVIGAIAGLNRLRRRLAAPMPAAISWRAGASVAGVALVIGALGWGLMPGERVVERPLPQAGDQQAAAPAPIDVVGTVQPTETAGQSPAVVPSVRIRERALSNDVVSNDEPVARDEADKLTALIRRQAAGSTDAPNLETGSVIPAADLPQGKVYGNATGKVRLVLRAIEGVWLRIESENGKTLFSRTLAAGDRYRVPVQNGLVLAARNAGALQYIVDGKAHGRIGAPGDIVVGFPLDFDKLAGK